MNLDPQLAIVITAVATSIGSLIAAVVAAVISLRNSRALVAATVERTAATQATTTALDTNTTKVEDYRLEINHRMDELLALTKSSAHAEGIIEGQASKVVVIPPPNVSTAAAKAPKMGDISDKGFKKLPHGN